MKPYNKKNYVAPRLHFSGVLAVSILEGSQAVDGAGNDNGSGVAEARGSRFGGFDDEEPFFDE